MESIEPCHFRPCPLLIFQFPTTAIESKRIAAALAEILRQNKKAFKKNYKIVERNKEYLRLLKPNI